MPDADAKVALEQAEEMHGWAKSIVHPVDFEFVHRHRMGNKRLPRSCATPSCGRSRWRNSS